MEKWTKGPWGLETDTRSPNGSDLVITSKDGGVTVATCATGSTGERRVERAEANARLISTAPELFEELTALVEFAETYGMSDARAIDWSGYLDSARSVLAKASGR